MKALHSLRRWWSAPFVRTAVWGALSLAAFAAGILLAYELALARVPQHRATLERLVRAQTGLDVRFSELNLHWGWYGPEAVFHSVELGEPVRGIVLLRAPQLIVGFDAWRSVQRGQLQAGRITLLAPDIDLEHYTGSARSGPDAGARAAASRYRMQLLQRWRGGRIDIEGGTLRLADPTRSAGALTLQIRRASLRRSDDQWSASALVFLPDRLGHTARLAAQFTGDPSRPGGLSGSMRFDGLQLVFAGWRPLLSAHSALAQYVPAGGEGDVTFRVNFNRGEIEKADGRVHARSVVMPGEHWGGGNLNLDRLRGDWRLAHRSAGWLLQVEEFDVGAREVADSLPSFSLQVGAGTAHGELGDIPLASLAAVAAWLAPQLDFRGAVLEGIAHEVKFDWREARPDGERLIATARSENFSFAPAADGAILSGLNAHFSATESHLDIELGAEQGRLALPGAPQRPLEPLRIASDLRLSRLPGGWHLNTPLLTVDYGPTTQLILSGSLGVEAPQQLPLLDVRATVVRAPVPLLRDLLGDAAVRHFGGAALSLTNGRIERAQFQLQTRLGAQPSDSPAGLELFAGTLVVRDGQMSAGEHWPDVQALDAQLDWNGARMRAAIQGGRAGPLQLLTAQAQWSADGQRPPRLSGQLRGRLEDALRWLGTQPQLEKYAPQLRHFAASGEALFNLDIVAPKSVRAVMLLEGAQLLLAEDLPPIKAVRGSLAFDSGRLQPSTLTGKWLGGPLTLRIAERRERAAAALAIQAQGFLDARELVSLMGFASLPEVAGQTPWGGEFTYRPQAAQRPARWQLRAEASLVGVSSRLPEPFTKTVVSSVPLRVEAAGSGDEAQVRVDLADRLRSQVALVRPSSKASWRVERGAVHFGGGSATIPAEPLIAVQGQVNHFDFSAYASLWQRAGYRAYAPAIVADLSATQLWVADHMFPDVRVQARKAAGVAPELDLQSSSLNGSVRWPASRPEVRLTAQNLDAAERARIVTHLQDSWKDPVVTVN